MTNLAHKIELKPNNEQRTYFKKASGISRFTWNWALASWNNIYEENKDLQGDEKQNVSGYSLKKEFNRIKRSDFPWVLEVSKYASQQPFIQLNAAYKRFFKGISGKPKFKRKNRSTDSFYVGGDQVKVQGKKVWVPNLGWVKLKEYLRFERSDGKIRSATFSRKADRWFVSLQVEVDVCAKTPIKESTGVDLGINTFAHLSDGIAIMGPKPLKKNLRSLKRISRALSKKTKGSKRYLKQKLKVQKKHLRISNIRKDTLHKITCFLTNEYKSIVIEDLNVSGMLKNHRLARSLADTGLYEFRRQLEYKSKMYGNILHIADRFFPSSKKCSSCEKIKDSLALSERTFKCECGLDLDRDLNASINLNNLLNLGSARPKVTPREMTAMNLWKFSKGSTSIVELGSKHQILPA